MTRINPTAFHRLQTRNRYRIASVIAVAVVGAAITLGSAQAGAPRTLRVHIHTLIFKVLRGGAVIAPPAKNVIGDEFFYVARISQGAHAIGRETVFCAVTDPPNYICTLTDHLPRGTIVHIGTNPIAGPYSDVITGGSGAYRNARGEVTTTYSSNNEGSVLYHFAP